MSSSDKERGKIAHVAVSLAGSSESRVDIELEGVEFVTAASAPPPVSQTLNGILPRDYKLAYEAFKHDPGRASKKDKGSDIPWRLVAAMMVGECDNLVNALKLPPFKKGNNKSQYVPMLEHLQTEVRRRGYYLHKETSRTMRRQVLAQSNGQVPRPKTWTLAECIDFLQTHPMATDQDKVWLQGEFDRVQSLQPVALEGSDVLERLKHGTGIDSSSEIGSTADDGARASGSNKRQRLAEDDPTASSLSNHHVVAATDRLAARLESNTLQANVSSLRSRLGDIEKNISRTESRVDTKATEVETYEDLLRQSTAVEEKKINGDRLTRRRKELDKLRASLAVFENEKDIVRDELAAAVARQKKSFRS